MYICFVGVILLVVLINNKSKKIKGGNKLKNIYDENLEECGTSKMNNGSWGKNYK